MYPSGGLGVSGLRQPSGLGVWIQGPKLTVLRSELGVSCGAQASELK